MHPVAAQPLHDARRIVEHGEHDHRDVGTIRDHALTQLEAVHPGQVPVEDHEIRLGEEIDFLRNYVGIQQTLLQERLIPRQWAGIGIGVLGVALIVAPKLGPVDGVPLIEYEPAKMGATTSSPVAASTTGWSTTLCESASSRSVPTGAVMSFTTP